MVWNPEVKTGALSKRAFSSNRSPVRFDNSLCDRKAHAGPAGDGRWRLAAKVFVEDEGNLIGVDAGPMIADGEQQAALLHLSGDGDGRSRRRVPGGVFEQVMQDALDENAIHVHAREIGRNLNLQNMRAQYGLHVFERHFDQLGDVLRMEIEL